MSLNEEIQILEEQLISLDHQIGELNKQRWELQNQRDQLVARLILEENLLQGTRWILHANDSPHLDFDLSQENYSKIKKIQELARTDWHSSFRLQEGVVIRFDDNDVSLYFTEAKNLLPFAQKHSLIIDGTDITAKLAKLKREIAALEAIAHQYKL